MAPTSPTYCLECCDGGVECGCACHTAMKANARRDDGGRAFPALERVSEYSSKQEQYVEHLVPVGGMSLRDYFAAKFLTTVQIHGSGVAAEKVAQQCYVMADAMLAERKRG